jgi:hypothetical protein
MPDRAFSLDRITFPANAVGNTEYVVVPNPLRRVLAFTGLSIDDVVDCPIARNTVYGYFKLHKQVQRTYEIVDLEKQWNSLGNAAC